MADVQIEYEYSSYDPGDTVRGVARIAAQGELPPLRQEIVIVIDVSGSMIPVIGLVKSVCEFALSRFVDRASCALVAFANEAKVVEPMAFLNSDLLRQYTYQLHALSAGGQTNLGAALDVAGGLLSESATKSILVITDGKPTVGPRTIADMRPRHGCPLYTVAIGSKCDDALLAQLAHQSGGMFSDAVQLDTVVSATGGLFGAIFGTVLSDVSLCLNASSLSTLPSRQTAFATTVSVGPMFTSEEVFIPFEIESSKLRHVTLQLYAAGKLICTHESSVPFEREVRVVNPWVRTQLLRSEVTRLLHAEPLDVEAAALLMARCTQDTSDVGAWLTKRLAVAMDSSSECLPLIRQELARARSTAYDDESDWLVPPCMRAFSQEARAFTPVGDRDSSMFDDIEGPGMPPMLRRAETWANGV